MASASLLVVVQIHSLSMCVCVCVCVCVVGGLLCQDADGRPDLAGFRLWVGINRLISP